MLNMDAGSGYNAEPLALLFNLYWAPARWTGSWWANDPIDITNVIPLLERSASCKHQRDDRLSSIWGLVELETYHANSFEGKRRCFDMKIPRYRMGIPTIKNKTISRPFYLYDGNSNAWKGILILKRAPDLFAGAVVISPTLIIIISQENLSVHNTHYMR